LARFYKFILYILLSVFYSRILLLMLLPFHLGLALMAQQPAVEIYDNGMDDDLD